MSKILTHDEVKKTVAELWSKAVVSTYEEEIRKAVVEEREACAKACEHFVSRKKNGDEWADIRDIALRTAADAIRARGQK